MRPIDTPSGYWAAYCYWFDWGALDNETLTDPNFENLLREVFR